MIPPVIASPVWTARRWMACLFLCLAVLAGYAASYSGRFDSTDEHRLADTATSLVRFGDWGRDETFWLNVTYEYPSDRAYPIFDLPNEERFAAWLLSWLFRLAERLPFGQMHVLWFFNALVTTAAVGTFFWLAVLLGYEARAAFVGGLLLAFATIVWLYSRTLFREPLVTAFLLLAALAALRWRQVGWRRGALWGLLLGVAAFAATLSKSSAGFGLPLAGALLLPDALLRRRAVRRLGDLALLVLLGLAVLVAYQEGFAAQLPALLPDALRTRLNTLAYTQTALHTYLFSVGGSVWGSSPILLAGIVGLVLLWRRGERRVVWGAAAAVWAYAFGHAYATGMHWLGGYSWPPRFLVPTVPMLLLGVLPLLRIRRAWLLLAPLLLYSVWIQWVGVVSFWSEYAKLMPAKARGLSEWTHGLNNIVYLRWVLLPQSWGALGVNMAWFRADLPAWAAVNALLAFAAASAGAWWLWRGQRVRYAVGALLVLGLLLAGNNALGLRALRTQDPLYQGEKPALWDALATLEADDSGASVLLLATRSYEGFIMNNLRSTTLRPIIFARQRGENVSAKDLARVRSRNSVDLLDHVSVLALSTLATHHDNVWLLADNSAFLAWAVRPIERYLAERYYFVREHASDDPTVRLVQFYLEEQPLALAWTYPELAIGARFGDALRLEGATLAGGTRARPGGFLPVALEWRLDVPTEDNIIITGFLLREGDNAVVAQWADTPPVMGFAPTFTWQAGERVRDRRAFYIPRNTPSGSYRIGVLAYRYVDGTLVRYPVSGDAVLDGTIALLPEQIMITND